MITFQQLIAKLHDFWAREGCIIHQGWDLEVGAGTFNPATFLRCLGPEPYKAAYVEPSRRPTDGRYGENPNRVQHYFQYQVILKPSPPDIQNAYLRSLEAVGLNLKKHDIRFVHDDWEQPTLGAWGLGWECWIDGMEVTQITYFQCVGGVNVKPVTGEITYGLERLAMYLQNVDNIFDVQWNDQLTYGDIYHRNEIEYSTYNFENADTSMWFAHFEDYEKEAKKLIDQNLPLPAYDFIAKASHAFNILDARGVVSVTERTGYITRIRNLVRLIAVNYVQSRESLSFPLLEKLKSSQEKKEVVLPPIPHMDPKVIEDDFLLEIGSEELPATFVPIGIKDLENDLKVLLDKEEISYRSLHTFGTPRRIAILVRGLAIAKKEKLEEKRGPAHSQAFNAQGNPTQAAKGFFRSLGLDAPTEKEIRTHKITGVEIRNIKGNEYLFAALHTPAQPTIEILAAQLPHLIANLSFPKKMRWADLEVTYPRPILWIVALFGKNVIPFVFGQVVTGNLSFGHRQLDPQSFTLEKPSDYVDSLRSHYVMVDVSERARSIQEQLDLIEKETHSSIIDRNKVLPEVRDLVEWPMALSATFDETFLKAPKELLTSEMIKHQKYFPAANPDGLLKNLFVIISNNRPSEQIRKGNCRVLSARLSDGVFLYEHDLKMTLNHYAEKLSHITFQKDLGSLADKVGRLHKHLEALYPYLQIGNLNDTKRAASLCKADLASSVVNEFPELQGIMGRYYALAQGEKKSIATAIEEHWMPLGENAPLPVTPEGILLSISDKVDNLIGCFSVGLKPTSSSDPYALRRQVLGIIKMLIAGKYRLPLRAVFAQCLKHFAKISDLNTILEEILQFVTNRVRTVFQDYGFTQDEIEASISFGVDDIYDMFCRVEALHQFRKSNKQFALLYEVFKRAKGQINSFHALPFEKKLLNESAEIELNKLLETSKDPFERSLSEHNYTQAYSLIAKIQPFLAKLFDEVKILAEDEKIKNNRIALLQQVFSRFSQLLDFSKIQEG